MPKCSGSSRAGTRCLKPINLCKGEEGGVSLNKEQSWQAHGMPDANAEGGAVLNMGC